MKQKLHKILSVFLAFSVLFSSFSYTVNKHVCGGETINVALFVSADSCDMEMDVCENSPHISKKGISEEDCCHDISKLVKGNDTNQQAQEVLSGFPQMNFIIAFVYSFVLDIHETKENISYTSYNPPLVFKDIQSLFQVFRI